MIYGMYLSSSGMLANLHRQDVVANNLANSQTVGFKRHVVAFQERATEAQARGQFHNTNMALEPIGGGMLVSPTGIDFSQGLLERDHVPLHAALVGDGFFAVQSPEGETYFTRDGRFHVNHEGQLAHELNRNMLVLDQSMNPITIEAGRHEISADGAISSNDRVVAKLGLFDVADRNQLEKVGGNRFSAPAEDTWQTATPTVKGGYVELSNADPAIELSSLINAQRQIELHANMIRLQDQTLGRLVNDVAKI